MSKLYTKVAVVMLGAMCANTASAELAFDTTQYQKALWMTTRFYGAQRSGYGPNWLMATYEPTNVSPVFNPYLSNVKKGLSFIKDADPSDGYDLTGGWWDCADFVKFGQTEFYSAYMLLLGYSEFPEGYGDYYSGDYNGYIGSGNYTWEGKAGVPNNIPDILDEVKYATDYFIKVIRNEKCFYYQIGEGSPDHLIWATSVLKSALPKEKGGELEGSRSVYRLTKKGTSMVAFCGATLAAMSRLYRQYDAAYADLCLEKAKTCVKFILQNELGNTGSAGGTFYAAKPKYDSDVCVLFTEMYRATGDPEYINTINDEGFTDFVFDNKTYTHWYTLCYNNTEDLAHYVMGMYAGTVDPELAEMCRERFASIMNFYKPAKGYVLNVKNNKWGMLRFPANQAFMYGLYNKMKGTLTEVDPYALASIEYIMGSNSENFSYITGFGDNYPRYPHYRNVFHDDSNYMPGCEIDEDFSQLGYMVGGSFNPSEYPDDIDNYQSGEGGIDYNAGLVGALGYINAILKPVSGVKNNSSDIQCYLYPNPVVDEVRIKSNETGATTVTIYNIEGQIELKESTTWEALAEGINVSKLANGQHILQIVGKNGNASKQFMKR